MSDSAALPALLLPVYDFYSTRRSEIKFLPD